MRSLLFIVVTAITAFALGLFFPWWTVAIAGLITALLFNFSIGRSFLLGFAAISLLWFLLTFFISSENHHLLATQMASVIAKTPNAFLAMALAAIIGGVAAGLGAASGAAIRRAIKN